MSELDGHDHPAHEEPHKPADDREEVYYEGSPLLRAEAGKLLGYWLAAMVAIAVPFVLRAARHEWPHWAVFVTCFLIGGLLLFMPVILQKTVRYRISNYRIDFERGVASKTIDTLELWHVDDIKFHQSLADRIMNTGTITIMSHDKTTPQLTLHGVPNPRPLFESLKQRIIAVKRQRGVVKMDVG